MPKKATFFLVLQTLPVFSIKSNEIQQNFTSVLLYMAFFSIRKPPGFFNQIWESIVLFSVENPPLVFIKAKKIQQSFTSVILHMLFFSVEKPAGFFNQIR